MKITDDLKETILNTDNKVLGTTGPHGLNVVPVSTVFVRDDQIWLVNYFFSKTAENLQANSSVVFTCWQDLAVGCQIKGEASYIESGDDFAEIKEWAAEKLPDRTVHAIVKIAPEEVHNVAPKA